jgi:hypothetical protein
MKVGAFLFGVLGGLLGALLVSQSPLGPEGHGEPTPLEAGAVDPTRAVRELKESVQALRAEVADLGLSVGALEAKGAVRESVGEQVAESATLPLSEAELRSWMASVDMRLSGGGLRGEVAGALEQLQVEQKEQQREKARQRAEEKLSAADQQLEDQVVSLTESLGLVGDQPQQLREALRARLDRASQLYEAWSSGSYTDEEIGTMKSSHASLAREEMEAFLTPAQLEQLRRQAPAK